MTVQSIHHAGMGEIIQCCSPQLMRAVSLGSCVAVVLYTDKSHCAVLSHIVLPSAHGQKSTDQRPGKYADRAIPTMCKMMTMNLHVQLYNCKAKIVGGAQMFEFTTENKDTLHIGKRNAEAVRRALTTIGIPIVADVTGGSSGRTIEFDPESKVMSVRTAEEGTCYY